MTIRWKKLSVKGDEDNTIMKIEHDGSTLFVPISDSSSSNSEYLQYKEWLAEGNTPEAAD